MATNPGIFTDWPWKRLGGFKYLVLAPWVLQGCYNAATTKEWTSMDTVYIAVLPLMLLRMLHSQVWITISRINNAVGKHLVVSDRGIEFEQVDRERNWDDHLIWDSILSYLGLTYILNTGRTIPLWRTDGAVMMALMHAGPVEFLYYWLHRALHHHFFFSRYHSHHHASIITEPITSVIHPFAEVVAYTGLFSIPITVCMLTGTISVLTYILYVFYIDFMNNMGHCNFEMIPKWLFELFPLLKYIMYTPSFHSLHHTQFQTNFSLFMPFYDYVYNTIDKSSGALHKQSLKVREETVDVVHLTHLTGMSSIYHHRTQFAGFAAREYSNSRWSMLQAITFPVTSVILPLLVWACGLNMLVVERNFLENKRLTMQTWVVPSCSIQYDQKWQKKVIHGLIEKAILEAERRGTKVLSLGLLNQTESLNGGEEDYLQKMPLLQTRVVDGSSLAAAVVINSVPAGTEQVVLTGFLSKVARAVAMLLCKRNIKVITTDDTTHYTLKCMLGDAAHNLVPSKSSTAKIWIIGETFDDSEQERAAKGTTFIPCSQVPLKTVRKDCIYLTTPAMSIPRTIKNVHTCENWLPRRVMSAWRVAGILHALEGWNEHECGGTILDIDRAWSAAIRHGFRPITLCS